MGRFIGSVLLVAILLALGTGLYFGSGRYDVAASRPPDLLDRFGDWVKRRAVPVQAAKADAMALVGAGVVEGGLQHYATNCLPCHGAPGVEGMEFRQGLQPRPPGIVGPRVQHWTDSELFWIVKNGIRMTGMPGFGVNHSDKEIADIVAFVRHAPALTDAEKDRLRAAGPAEHHHEDAEPADHHHDAEPGE
jgi:mono/diheme cytochrome c family protein